jgi:hypothetical protein
VDAFPLLGHTPDSSKVESPLLLAVERAMDGLRQAGAPITANAGVTEAHDRMPFEVHTP